MPSPNIVRASLIIIGNEILSGRTLDKNTQHIALKLGENGIRLSEVRVIPDVKDTIIKTAQEMSEGYDYVFTTGGLGPTHDDITVDCIAEAFGAEVEVNAEAYRRLENHYGAQDFTEARQRMARIPKGAALIDNPVSTAPGFYHSKCSLHGRCAAHYASDARECHCHPSGRRYDQKRHRQLRTTRKPNGHPAGRISRRLSRYRCRQLSLLPQRQCRR